MYLIDWGSAEFYFPEADYLTVVTEYYFRAPEALLNYAKY